MIDNREILSAQKSERRRNRLIRQQSAFIRKCAAKAAGKWIDPSDDLYSVALMAFNDAITAYCADRGSFSAFAAVTIRNRVIDHIRKEQTQARVLPFSGLGTSSGEGAEIPFDAEDPSAPLSDAAIEIFSLREELIPFGISFEELPRVSPKAGKTKRACHAVIRYLLDHPILLHEIRKTRRLPNKTLLHALDINEKLLERHRKYILTGLLILSGEYEIMASYFQLQRGDGT